MFTIMEFIILLAVIFFISSIVYEKIQRRKKYIQYIGRFKRGHNFISYKIN